MGVQFLGLEGREERLPAQGEPSAYSEVRPAGSAEDQTPCSPVSDLQRQGDIYHHSLAQAGEWLDRLAAGDLPKLATMTFQVKLGSMLDKAKRIEALTPTVAALLKLDDKQVKAEQRAAYLCKADLGSQMVVEMTSLQGIMGREYASLTGESDAVANALAEQYDRAPESSIGAAISLADRFDSLSGLFALGLAPTGSADPWALRRAALGIVETLIKHQVSFSLRAALEAAAKLQPGAVGAKED